MYKFTGKERDTETNLDYFGARYYDSEIGRWLSVDPLADRYPGWSPYNYCLNSPLKYVDPDGRYAWIANVNNRNPYYFPSIQGVNYSHKDDIRLNIDLNSYIDKWKDNAPAFSNYLRDNSIAIAYANITTSAAAYNDGSFEENGKIHQKIILDIESINKLGPNGQEASLFHEIGHSLYQKEGENGAYSAMYSMKLIDNDGIDFVIDTGKMPLTPIQEKAWKNGDKNQLYNLIKKNGDKLLKGKQ